VFKTDLPSEFPPLKSLTYRLMGAGESLRESIGAPLYPHEREEYDQQVEQVRSALGEGDFTVAWQEGRAMAWEEAVEYALDAERF
jgi:hypothetical protein